MKKRGALLLFSVLPFRCRQPIKQFIENVEIHERGFPILSEKPWGNVTQFVQDRPADTGIGDGGRDLSKPRSPPTQD
jgi:hypothetical protein